MAKQERAVRTREALIRAAAEVFGREGFTVASLTAISARAGVSNGALHFHFASKAALADAVEDAALARLRALTGAPLPRGGPGGRLQHLVTATHGLARGLTHDTVLRAGFDLSGDPARVPHANLREQWQLWVEGVVERAGDEGELRPGVAPEGAVTTVVAATVGFEVLGARDAVWLSPKAISRFWQLLLPTLASGEILGTLGAGGTPPPMQTG